MYLWTSSEQKVLHLFVLRKRNLKDLDKKDLKKGMKTESWLKKIGLHIYIFLSLTTFKYNYYYS